MDNAKLRDETLMEKKDLGNRKVRTRFCGRLKTMPEAARGEQEKHRTKGHTHW